MDLLIKGKTALITGGDSGIGWATAKVLGEEGTNIILSDKDPEALQKAASLLQQQLSTSVRVSAIPADLTSDASITELAAKIKNEFGGIDIVVNSAGARGAAGPFLELTDDDWQKTIDIDLLGAVRISRAFIPHMLAKGWGRMVFISSENAFQPYEDESPYNACKAAIINLSKCLSRSYGRSGILINTVSPAFIETPMTDAMMEELSRERNISLHEAVSEFLKTDRPHIVVQRRGKPEEVAHVIAFLCSELASYVSGSNYRVDAGAVESAFG